MMILVTGGSGFIGSHVVDKLIEAGHKVRSLDLKPPHRPDIDFVKGNLLEYEVVKKACQDVSHVFHLAAMASVNEAFEDPILTSKLNTTGTVNVLESARQTAVERVLFASTEWVYSGSKGNYMHENSPFFMPGAGHIYTSTKIAGELFCHDYQKLYGQKFTIMRYGIPYGPRARAETVIALFVKKALAGEPILLFGLGEQFRNFVYVEDLAVGNVLCLKTIAKNKTYNLTGDKKITINQVAGTIQKILGTVKIKHLSERPGDYAGKNVSNDLAKKELAWEPSTSFEEGMKRVIEWYQKIYASIT